MTARARSSAIHVAGTTPYPWPYDGRLQPEQTALLVVAPSHGGPTAPAGVWASIVALADALGQAGGAVVHVTTAPPPSAAHASHAPEEEPSRITAPGHDGFFGTELDLVLRTAGADRLLLAGAGLETCVHSTMRSANDRGYECLLVADACAPVDAALVGPALSMIEMSGGIFGAVGRTAEVLQALAR